MIKYGTYEQKNKKLNQLIKKKKTKKTHYKQQ